MTTDIGTGAALHALLIGIDRYTSGTAPGAPFFRTLAGGTADVVAVAAYLHAAQPLASLTLLVAPPDGVALPEGAERPTYRNIVTAWQRLRDTVPRGGRIYIHYAGHGTRAATIAAGDRASAYDEVIAPCDVNEPGGRYLRDLEIAYLLREMSDRGQLVTLVMDSCHAAGLLEAPEQATERSNGDDDPRAEIVPSLVAGDAALRALARELRDRRAIASGWAFGDVVGAGYTLIAACQQDEGANELTFSDGHRGALTYYWLDTLRRCGPAVSYATVFQRVFAQVRRRFPKQSPALLGERTRQVLGAGIGRQPRGLIVRDAFDAKEGDRRGGVELSGGAAALVAAGDEYAIVPFQEDAERVDLDRMPRVVIDRVFSTYARGKRIGAEGPIEPGDQAILVRHGTATEIHVPAPDGRADDVAPRAAATLEALRAAIRRDRSNRLVCGRGDPGGLRVTIDRGATPPVFAVADAEGRPLLGLGDAIEVGDPAATSALIERLRHVARFRSVREHGPADPEAFTDALTVALWHLAPDGDATRVPARAQLVEGARVELRIQNPSLHDLHLVILELGPDWAIRRLRAHDTAATILAPGQAWTAVRTAARPTGWPRGAPATVRWKVIATRGPVTGRELILPPLGSHRAGALHDASVAEGLVAEASAPSAALELPVVKPLASPTETPAPRAERIELPCSDWLAIEVELRTIAGGAGVVTPAR